MNLMRGQAYAMHEAIHGVICACPISFRGPRVKDAAMPRFDLPVDELRSYRPEVAEPADFDDFWEQTLEESRALAQPIQLRRIDSPLQAVEVYD
ncbi:MAG: acetylxylan esterase, partial [Microbacterium gubbeenense]